MAYFAKIKIIVNCPDQIRIIHCVHPQKKLSFLWAIRNINLYFSVFLLIKPSTHNFINSAHMRTPLHLTPHENFWMTTSHSSHFLLVQVIPHVLLTLFPVLVNITCMTKPKLLTVIHRKISERNVVGRLYKQKCNRLKLLKKKFVLKV